MLRGFEKFREPRWAAANPTGACGRRANAWAPAICTLLALIFFGCSYIPSIQTPVVNRPPVAANPTAQPPATPTPGVTVTTAPPSPPVAPTTGLESVLSGLILAPVPAQLPDYTRSDWRHWVDANRDCQDARQEVLIAESTEPVVFKSEDKCRVESGLWIAPFTGVVETDPSKLDVDHMVPLANAHRSGGHAWTKDRKRQYANDLTNPAHLVAVTRSANRSKGSRGPEEWRPPDETYWCQYATDWASIKTDWGLTVTLAERDALAEMLTTCERGAE